MAAQNKQVQAILAHHMRMANLYLRGLEQDIADALTAGDMTSLDELLGGLLDAENALEDARKQITALVWEHDGSALDEARFLLDMIQEREAGNDHHEA